MYLHHMTSEKEKQGEYTEYETSIDQELMIRVIIALLAAGEF